MQVKDCVLIEPYTCNEEESVMDVSKKLRATTLRHIFVVNSQFYPTGIISVIDINNRVVAEGKDAKTVKAKEIMSKPVEIVQLTDDAETISKKMMEKQRVMNAVVKDGKMVGIITLNQLLRRLE